MDKLTHDLLERASVQGLDPECFKTESAPTKFVKP